MSEEARRFINNFLSATAARVVEKDSGSDSSSDSSDAEAFRGHAGSLNLVRDTLKGLARRDDEGDATGVGRYDGCIQLGRSLWETEPLNESEMLSATQKEARRTCSFPDAKEATATARKFLKGQDENLAPLGTPHAASARVALCDYEARVRHWVLEVAAREQGPTAQQLAVLSAVAERILQEVEAEKLGGAAKPWSVEPLRALIHGEPGTGKSRVIQWMRELFEEALGWTHGQQFLCVAFQNRMAAAIGGVTLHAGADLPRPGAVSHERRREHSDVDNLYIRNARLRWIILDEVSMVSDELLGEFETHLSTAACQNVFSKRPDKSRRIFGGYNIVFLGDFWQLPPIPESGALFLPPNGKKSSSKAKRVVDMFWKDNADAINFSKSSLCRRGSRTLGTIRCYKNAVVGV